MVELLINSIDRDSFLVDHDIEETIEWYSSEATIEMIDDDSNTLRDNLRKFQNVKIYNAAGDQVVFNGAIIIIKGESDNNKLFELYCQDYWFRFVRKHINKIYTNQTASDIIKNLIDTYFPGLYTYTRVQTTTTQYTYNLRGKNVAKFFQELANNEGFVIYIDTSGDLVFEQEEATDSGVRWDYTLGNIYSEGFESSGVDLVNAVLVEGKGGSPEGDGVGIYYIDRELVEEHEGEILEMPKVTDQTLQTEEECRLRGEAEIIARNQSPFEGIVSGSLDYSIQAGTYITLTIPHRGYISQTFLVRQALHKKSEATTKIAVLYSTKGNEGLIADILLESRRLQEDQTDDSIIYPFYNVLIERVKWEAYVTVERRINTGAEAFYGRNDDIFYGHFFYGTQNIGAFEEILPEEPIKVMNIGFKKIWAIVGDVGTMPNQLDGTNAYLAYGNDGTIINFSDSIINNEDGRVQIDTTPPSSSGQEISIEFTISDSDMTAGSIKNLGILNALSVGDLFFAGVLSETITKNIGEDLLITIRMTVVGNKSFLTDNGRDRLLDLLTDNSAVHLDNANAHIELPDTTTPYRDSMESDYPTLKDAGDKLTFHVLLSTAEITSNGLDGEDYTGLDLYDAASGSVQIIDGDFGSTVLITEGEPQRLEIILIGVRS